MLAHIKLVLIQLVLEHLEDLVLASLGLSKARGLFFLFRVLQLRLKLASSSSVDARSVCVGHLLRSDVSSWNAA